jgi:hypothetical protein
VISDDDTEEKESASLLPARKVWKDVPAKNKFPFFDIEEEPENWALATSRCIAHRHT